jgi:hypothetical protein
VVVVELAETAVAVENLEDQVVAVLVVVRPIQEDQAEQAALNLVKILAYQESLSTEIPEAMVTSMAPVQQVVVAVGPEERDHLRSATREAQVEQD